MVIDGAPHIEPAADRLEQFVVPGSAVARRVLDRADPGSPGTVRRDLARQPMRRLFHVVRGLHRHVAARRQLAHQARIEFLVPRHPLQGGVRQDHVVASRRIPGPDVRQFEGQAGQALARRVDHVLRIVRAADRGVRIARGQHLGGVARAAAQVHRPRRALIGQGGDRSRTGRVRSFSKAEYCLADQFMAAPEWCLRALRTLRPQRPRHKYPDRASSISAAYGAPAMPQCAHAHTGIPHDRAGTPARHGRHGRSVRALAVRAASRLADHCRSLPLRPAVRLCRTGGARAARSPRPAFRAAGRIVLRPHRRGHRRRSAARLARADPVRDLPAQSAAGTGLRPIPDRPTPSIAAARRPARPHAAGTARRSACGPSCWTRCRGSRIG